MIILTSAQADVVRGPTANNAYLEPRRISDDVYILPEEVLADPDHAVHHAFLASLPIGEVVFPEPEGV
ncbi:hypothetical protein ACSBOB_20200 [Mesorhizobium sp. ASY16-5R]|uniref:hypothetical protein n=1 Tax=Mesorhizobium sp. ASY16-5R TaxID=3445772 RepID=UPI003FA03AC9